MDLDRAREAEKEYHDRFHSSMGSPKLVDVEAFENRWFRPSYDTGNYYADSVMVFRDGVMRNGGWHGRTVLDYACGQGHWGTYYALTGASKVYGFDLVEAGIHMGQERNAAQNLTDKVSLSVMDAMNLGFADDTFEMVLGMGVLHHVIKYPGVFEELHRVMKPGGSAHFFEGLADFPLFKLWWKIKGEVEQGDVPIFAKDIRRQASMFSNVQITGDALVHSLKRFVFKPNPGAIRRLMMRTMRGVDTALFKICPPLRAWGCFSYIRLTK